MLGFDGKRCTWTHFVIFEMADKAKLSRRLLLTALHCIYMRKKLYDSAPENISVFIQQRNISFHDDVSPKSREIGGLVVRLWQKLKKTWDPQQVTAESWAWTTWGVEEQLLISSSCLLIFLDESKSFKLINFCLNLNRPMEATKAQHVFIAGTFGNDRFTTIVVWYRALSCDPTNYESRLSWGWHLRIAVPITTRTLRFA